jgi:hypothetical protein
MNELMVRVTVETIRTACFIRTHVEIGMMGVSRAAFPHCMSYLPLKILRSYERPVRLHLTLTHAAPSVLPFPISTLFMLMTASSRPAFFAKSFWSKISAANTGRYRPCSHISKNLE